MSEKILIRLTLSFALSNYRYSLMASVLMKYLSQPGCRVTYYTTYSFTLLG